jgi:F-type H+-transporting ATPase subunit b
MLNLTVSQIIIQIIGFLAMLWILKKFGWKPLLDHLDARRDKIRSEFDSIDAKKGEVDQLVAKYEQKLKEIESDSRNKIQEAVEEGHKISGEIQKNAQAQAKEILEKVKLEINGEIAKAKNQLKDDMIDLVMNVSKKILKEDLNAENQKKLIAKFIDEAQLK